MSRVGLQAINGFGAHFLSALTQQLAAGEGWGGQRDLNPRQPDPQSGALTGLSYDHQPDKQARFIPRVRQVLPPLGSILT